jgi:hypothetical protein
VDFSDILERSIRAVDAEIVAVRARPARDVLTDGRLKPRKESVHGARYVFPSTHQGLKYAESVKVTIGSAIWEVSVTDTDDASVTLQLPEDIGERVDRLEVEWENDFVLRKLRDQLGRIEDDQDEVLRDRVMRVLAPRGTGAGAEVVAGIEGLNDRQSEAVAMCQVQPVTFIWGPPGTGKTSTLGPVMAGFLKQRKRVLFVSNTNRAVDVGLMSALSRVDDASKTYRLGDPAMDDPRIDAHRFDMIAESAREALRAEMLLASDEIESERLIDRMASLEFGLLRKARLVAATLAKVCTSELLGELDFDVVVLDEASMASIPYVLVMAAKAASHVVIAGDPMQLPPIAQAEDPEARTWMETDIYALASGAASPAELFAWHDRNPSFTAFFDTQYRMRADLSDLISRVFYDGRLKSGLPPARRRKSEASVRIVDTSPMGPSIQNRNGAGFQPANEVHQEVVRNLVASLVLKDLVNPYEIGIVVPFRSAVWDIRQALRNDGFTEIEVGTVHTFQGREKQVIIFDTVMSGLQERGRTRHFPVRPFDEAKSGLQVPRLLNVAFSRAKSQLYLVADLDHMRAIYARKFLGKLIGTIRKQTQD